MDAGRTTRLNDRAVAQTRARSLNIGYTGSARLVSVWLGEASVIDHDQVRRETVEEFIRVGGPGGQHRNRNETGVRLKHIPTGVVVMATESRSQARNREVAWRRLIERITARMKRRKKRIPTAPTATSKRRRLEEKRRRSEIKKKRGGPDQG